MLNSLHRDTIESLDDCESCGSKKTLHLDEDHLYENETLGISMTLPAFVCSECGDETYETPAYRKILEEHELKKGNLHKRFLEEDGKLIKFTLH